MDLPPPFHSPKLIKAFHTTCYHGWMASDDLFDGFSLESDHLLDIVCKSLNITFPGIKYDVVHKDIFHQTVRVLIMTIWYWFLSWFNRYMTTSRHKGLILLISLSPLWQIIFLKWQRRKSRNGLTGLVQPIWVSWFIRSHALRGAVSWRGCQTSRQVSQTYCDLISDLFLQKPKGLLMTPFVTNLVKPYLKYMNDSLINYGHPHRLIGLTLVLVCSPWFICPSFSYSVEWHSLSMLSAHLKWMGLSRILGLSIPNIKLFLWNILKVLIHSRSGPNFIRLANLVELTAFIQMSRMILLQIFHRWILADVHSISVAAPLNSRLFLLI